MPETRSWAERACGALIRVASLLAPVDRRSTWTEEWEAEVWHHLRGRGMGTPASGFGMVLRCFGAFPHALWIRKENWTVDALLWGLRVSARRLARDPAFTLPAVIVFGLAVAAATTIFSSYEAVVLRPLAYREAPRLVSLWAQHTERGWHQEYVAPANFLDWRDQVGAFEDIAAYGDYSWDQIIVEDGEAEVVEAGPVTGNLFDVLGVTAHLGRVFRMEETWSDANPVTVLSHGYWVRRFGADPGVVGQRIELSGVSYEVIGVMSSDFRYLAPNKELWVPFRWERTATGAAFFRRAHLVRAVGRLSDDASLGGAEQQLRAVADQLAEDFPATNEGLSAGLTPLTEYLLGDRGTTLRALLGAVSILLLAAGLNVAYLILVRWRRRHREVAIRRALGAGTGVLAREFALESLLLSALGGGLGLALSVLGIRLMTSLAPAELLASADLRISGLVLLVTVGTMATAAFLFTLLPVRTSARVRPAGMGGHGSRSSVSMRGTKAIEGFVVLQVALSVVLIFSATLLARSFVALRSVDAGFTASGVLTFAVPFPDGSDEAVAERASMAEQITSDLAELPGVTAVGAVRRLPVTGNGWTSFFSVEESPSGAGSFEIVHREADAGYFEALQVPVVAGRLFRTDEDDALLVNETFARRAFGSEEALGRRIAFSEQPSPSTRWWRVVGVVGDERQNSLRVEARPEVFTHYTFDVPGTFRFAVRTGGDPNAFVAGTRAVIRAVDPGLPVDEIASLEEVLAGTLTQDRFVTLLAAAFALLAALLAIVGVYGVTAQTAEIWQQEFAVRLAVGARPLNLFASVLTRGAALVVGGLFLGLAAAFPTGRLVEVFLYDVSTSDPKTMGIAATLVTASGLFAVLPCAIRSMRTDPAKSLSA